MPFGLEPIANLVASCLSMVSILGAPRNGAILPETMLRTHAAFEGVGAAYSISLDCAFLKGTVNSLGSETMLIGFAARVGCGSHEASMVLSMVFGCCGLFLLELCSLLERKPCLAGLRPSGGLCSPLYTSGSVFAKHGFRSNRLQSSRGNNPQQPNTILRTIEAP